jgi:HEAT repeat protein
MKSLVVFKRFLLFILIFFSSLTIIFPEDVLDIIILLEMAKDKEKDIKLIALAYIEDCIENKYYINKRLYNIILEALNILANEHINSPIITDGEIKNNFPDVRIKAIKLLGRLGTIEAYNSLLEITLIENDPEALKEAQDVLNRFEFLEITFFESE